jgi:hypothetical protein
MKALDGYHRLMAVPNRATRSRLSKEQARDYGIVLVTGRKAQDRVVARLVVDFQRRRRTYWYWPWLVVVAMLLFLGTALVDAIRGDITASFCFVALAGAAGWSIWVRRRALRLNEPLANEPHADV